MIDKEHLRNKQVAFRLLNSNRVNIGVVLHAENDGFWIDSPHLVGELQQDLGVLAGRRTADDEESIGPNVLAVLLAR